MADVHEESQFGISQLLGMYMLLQSQVVLLLTTTIGQIGPNGSNEQYQVEEVGPYGFVPRCVNHHGELTLGSGLIVALSNDSEMIGTWLHVRERHLVRSGLQADVRFLIDAVGVGDVFWVLIGKRRKLDGK